MVALHDNKPRNNIRRPSGARCRRGYGCRLVPPRAAGADVTALEYNPMLAAARSRLGSRSEVGWWDGPRPAVRIVLVRHRVLQRRPPSYALTRQQASRRCCEVLKPGGWLITTGDPYRASHLGEDHELSVFDRHPGVLLGVNEFDPLVHRIRVGLGQISRPARHQADHWGAASGCTHPFPVASLAVRSDCRRGQAPVRSRSWSPRSQRQFRRH